MFPVPVVPFGVTRWPQPAGGVTPMTGHRSTAGGLGSSPCNLTHVNHTLQVVTSDPEQSTVYIGHSSTLRKQSDVLDVLYTYIFLWVITVRDLQEQEYAFTLYLFLIGQIHKVISSTFKEIYKRDMNETIKLHIFTFLTITHVTIHCIYKCILYIYNF